MGNKKRDLASDLPPDLQRLDLLIRKALENPAVREGIASDLKELAASSRCAADGPAAPGPPTRPKRPARWVAPIRRKRTSSTSAS